MADKDDSTPEGSEAQTTYIFESEDGHGQLTEFETGDQYLLLPGDGSQPDEAVGGDATGGQAAGDEFLLSVGLAPGSEVEPMDVGGEGSWELSAVVPSCDSSTGETSTIAASSGSAQETQAVTPGAGQVC